MVIFNGTMNLNHSLVVWITNDIYTGAKIEF